MDRVNPNWNEGIARLLPNDYQAADRAYRELTTRWPQINRRTSVSFTSRHTLEMVDSSYMPPVLPTKRKRVAISGWGKLKSMNSLFTLKQLDDPDMRAKYHAGLIDAILHLPMYALWRIAGRLFKRDVWVQWGTTWVYEDTIPAAAPRIATRKIELQPLGIYWQELGGWTNQFYLMCGYDPLNDTFFVGKR